MTLDTPNSEVNVFDQAVAKQILDFAEAADPRRLRAVVVESGKPRSFINGAKLLLLAQVVRSRERLLEMTGLIRASYRAFRDLPVPTIAVIEGSCLGCGVEFALQFDYRFASTGFETEFYLTEIADYLLIPNFGATQDLPRLIEFEAAVNLLLWGERWSASRALLQGLVDATFDDSDRDKALRNLVGEVLSNRRSPRPRKRRWNANTAACAEATRARIELLPREYRPLFRDAISLLESAAQQDVIREHNYTAEIEACARSLATGPAKAAMRFFFSRQMASRVTLGGHPPHKRMRLRVDGAPEPLRRELGARHFRDVALVGQDDEGPAIDLGAKRFCLGYASTIPPGCGDPVAYALCCHGRALFEVACRGELAEARDLASALTRIGFSAVITYPREQFVLSGLIDAFFAPVTRFAFAPGDVAASLHEFGFLELPHSLAQLLPREHPGFQLAGVSFTDGSPQVRIVDALLLSLLAFAVECVEENRVAHRSVLDLMAREVLYFPLIYGGLTRYLSRERARLILDRAGDGSDLCADAATLAPARRYLSWKRDF